MSDAETVPARYQPDPWIDSQVTRAGGRAGLRVPRIMLRDWLGLSAGQTVGIAPCDAASVWFGSRVPRFFAEKTLTGRADGVPQATSRKPSSTTSAPALATRCDFTNPTPAGACALNAVPAC